MPFSREQGRRLKPPRRHPEPLLKGPVRGPTLTLWGPAQPRHCRERTEIEEGASAPAAPLCPDTKTSRLTPG